ncbi:MAG TPA: hypothetical protein VKN37_02960 [Roseovarius sp.]|nr:hypothetical protein [Roseovarius sp.]
MQVAGQDHVGRQQCLVGVRACASLGHGVGAGQREGRLSQRFLQPFEAEVEFVIAERAGIIPHEVHRAQHRMVPAPALSRLRGQVAERGALQKVAIVEQYAVFIARLDPRLTDKGRDTGKAAGLIGTSCEVIERQDVGMHIGRDHNAQAHRFTVGGGMLRVWNISGQIHRLHLLHG